MTLNETLLQTLWACSASCEYCADKCTEKGEGAESVRIMRDCSDLCMTAARFYTRGSVFTKTIVEQCIQACSMCLETQENMKGPWHDECRESCNKCLASCQEYLQAS
jgi:hypothetical protein